MDFTNLLNVWGPGQLLAFSGLDGPTDAIDGLTLRTASPGSAIDCKLPGKAKLVFDRTEPQRCRLAGDCFELITPSGTSRGAFLDTHHLLVHGPVTVEGADDQLAVVKGGDLTLLASTKHVDQELVSADLDAAMVARLDWLMPQDLPADKAYRRTYAKCLSQLKAQVHSPQGEIAHRWSTPNRWPHRWMWLWDSAFHAIGLRHHDVGLARDLVAAVLDRQLPDGRVAHRVHPDDEPSGITQPPVLALAAALVDEVEPDDGWIASLYPQLTAYLDWNAAHRDSDGAGLLEWRIEGNPNCRSGESGMDNSTRFDAATQLDATDFNSFQAHEYEQMMDFAVRLGKDDEAQAWRDRHAGINELIDGRLWDEERSFYCDRDVTTDRSTGILANAGFLPLLCGAVPREKVPFLVEAYRDPQRFGTHLPVPTVAAKDPGYAKDMWRGPVWVNLNWLIARGFARSGQPDVAADLRQRTLAAVVDHYERHGTLFEYYDDRGEVEPPELLRKGRCAPEVSPFHQVFHDYGWTAALFVDWVAAGTGSDRSSA